MSINFVHLYCINIMKVLQCGSKGKSLDHSLSLHGNETWTSSNWMGLFVLTERQHYSYNNYVYERKATTFCILCFIYKKNVRHLTWSGVLVGYKIVVTLLYEVQMM